VASISQAARLRPQARALNESCREMVDFVRIMEMLLNAESSYPVWLAKEFVRQMAKTVLRPKSAIMWFIIRPL